MTIFKAIYHILWGDLITIPLPGGSSLGLSLLVLILIPSGIYFTPVSYTHLTLPTN